MSRVRSRDTRPEIILRRAIHARGGRFRVDGRGVPGRPDILVRKRKLAVFVDGDLWHGNPEEWRRRGHNRLSDMFPTRTSWWVAKIERNIARDREVDKTLADKNWRVLRLWASDVLADPESAADQVMSLLRESRPKVRRGHPAVYKPPAGLLAAERAAEQDRAAGGRDARFIAREDGTVAAASVTLRCPNRSHRVYAYLRWTVGGGRTSERYLGDVTACPDRASALRAAWSLHHDPTPSTA